MNSMDRLVEAYLTDVDKYGWRYVTVPSMRVGERFGQWFVNRYIKDGTVLTSTGTDLFYEEDASLQYEAIKKWLEQYHYTTSLPPKIMRSN